MKVQWREIIRNLCRYLAFAVLLSIKIKQRWYASHKLVHKISTVSHVIFIIQRTANPVDSTTWQKLHRHIVEWLQVDSFTSQVVSCILSLAQYECLCSLFTCNEYLRSRCRHDILTVAYCRLKRF
jgi:hypothetical protein